MWPGRLGRWARHRHDRKMNRQASRLTHFGSAPFEGVLVSPGLGLRTAGARRRFGRPVGYPETRAQRAGPDDSVPLILAGKGCAANIQNESGEEIRSSKSEIRRAGRSGKSFARGWGGGRRSGELRSQAVPSRSEGRRWAQRNRARRVLSFLGRPLVSINQGCDPSGARRPAANAQGRSILFP